MGLDRPEAAASGFTFMTLPLVEADVSHTWCELATDPRCMSKWCKIQDFRKENLHERFQRVRFSKDMTESNPQNRRLGYARVSNYGQTPHAPLKNTIAERRT